MPDVTRLRSSADVRDVTIARPQVHEVRRRLTKEAIAQFVADYEAGQSTPTFMEEYHLAKGTIRKLLESHGVTMRHQQMAEGETVEAIQLYEQGWSLARVGEHFGRNPSTIQGVLRQAGVTRRRTWERGTP